MNQLYSKAVSFILKGTNHLFLTFIVVVSKYLRNIKCLNFEETKGKRLLVIRHGGLGDLIFMIPSLRKIKNLHPGIQITVMTRGCNFELFQHVPYVDRVIKHAWPNLFSLFCHDYVVFLDNSVESDPDAKTVNIYDLFAEKYFGILLEKHEKNPFLTFNYWDCVELDEVITFPSSNRLRKIGIQLRAGSPVRTPAPVFWTHLISTMLEERSDSVIYLIVEARFCEYAQTIINGLVAPSIQKRVVNMARYAGGVSRLINMIALMDLVVVPDSSAAHIAAGLGVPLVGIYGPFPGQLRVKYYDNTTYFNAPAACAPCFTHGHNPCHKAQEMSVACSPCFEQIDVKSVVEHAWKLIDNKNNKLPLYENYKLIKPNFCSETSKYRGEILEIFKGISGSAIESLNGIELGCGGDVLVAEVIAIDYDFPYTKCGDSPLHLKGDCRTLPWFADNALDYLYSSHLFEDFSQSENFDVLAEWIRVLKPAGYMLLLLPDQQRYECHCARKGDVPNEHHQIPEFGPEYLASLVEQKSGLELVTIIRFWERQGNADDYNFLAVMQKNPK